MKKLLGVILSIGLLAAGAVAEELYRWVDKEGRVHFGDRPPVQAKAEDIGAELRPINSADGGALRSGSGHRRQEQLQQEYDQRQQEQRQQQQQQLARACRDARRRLQALSGRVYFVDENGREVKMTERQRQQEAEKLQREIAQICG